MNLVDLLFYKRMSGGSSGTSDYTSLSNKPQINSTTLSGNKTSDDLGLVSNSATNTDNIVLSPTNGKLYYGSETANDEVVTVGYLNSLNGDNTSY